MNKGITHVQGYQVPCSPTENMNMNMTLIHQKKKIHDNRSVFQSAGGRRTLLDISTRNSALIKHKKETKTVPG